MGNKVCSFKWISDEHIRYFSDYIMKNDKYKNLNLEKKRRRMIDRFPELEHRLSRSTLWKI